MRCRSGQDRGFSSTKSSTRCSAHPRCSQGEPTAGPSIGRRAQPIQPRAKALRKLLTIIRLQDVWVQLLTSSDQAEWGALSEDRHDSSWLSRTFTAPLTSSFGSRSISLPAPRAVPRQYRGRMARRRAAAGGSGSGLERNGEQGGPLLRYSASLATACSTDGACMRAMRPRAHDWMRLMQSAHGTWILSAAAAAGAGANLTLIAALERRWKRPPSRAAREPGRCRGLHPAGPSCGTAAPHSDRARLAPRAG
jgi:hypothetical protein